MNVYALRNLIVSNARLEQPLPVGAFLRVAQQQGVTFSWATVRNHCERMAEEGILARAKPLSGVEFAYVLNRQDILTGTRRRRRRALPKSAQMAAKYKAARKASLENRPLRSMTPQAVDESKGSKEITQAHQAINRLGERMENLERELAATRAGMNDAKARMTAAETELSRTRREFEAVSTAATEAAGMLSPFAT